MPVSETVAESIVRHQGQRRLRVRPLTAPPARPGRSIWPACAAARRLQTSRSVITSYFEWLHTAFLVHELPGWSATGDDYDVVIDSVS